jgi:hypothetical protein
MGAVFIILPLIKVFIIGRQACCGLDLTGGLFFSLFTKSS